MSVYRSYEEFAKAEIVTWKDMLLHPIKSWRRLRDVHVIIVDE